MEKFYKNRPNFLGSEVGLCLKTITVPADASYVTENGRKIVKAGTYFSTPFVGLLFQDVDITDGKKIGSLMTKGQYIDANLPASVSASAATLSANGLYAFAEGSVSRPDFGTAGLSALANPSLSVVTSTISWASISNAIGYTIYDSNKAFLSALGASVSEYAVSAIGTYYVQANADNINYKSSALVSASVAALS